MGNNNYIGIPYLKNELKSDTWILEKASNDNGKLTINPSGWAKQSLESPTIVQDHKYFLRAEIQGQPQSNTTFELNLRNGASIFYFYFAEGDYSTKTAIGGIIDTGDFSLFDNPAVVIRNKSTTKGIVVSNLSLIDLTESYGFENEPDTDWCLQNLTFFLGDKIGEQVPLYKGKARAVPKKVKKMYVQKKTKNLKTIDYKVNESEIVNLLSDTDWNGNFITSTSVPIDELNGYYSLHYIYTPDRISFSGNLELEAGYYYFGFYQLAEIFGSSLRVNVGKQLFSRMIQPYPNGWTKMDWIFYHEGGTLSSSSFFLEQRGRTIMRICGFELYKISNFSHRIPSVLECEANIPYAAKGVVQDISYSNLIGSNKKDEYLKATEWIPGHKYYIQSFYKTWNDNRFDYLIGEQMVHSTLTARNQKWSRDSFILDYKKGTSLIIDVEDLDSALFGDMQIIDLTEAFGEGQEPALDWCDVYIPQTDCIVKNKYYSSVELKPVKRGYVKTDRGRYLFYYKQKTIQKNNRTYNLPETFRAGSAVTVGNYLVVGGGYSDGSIYHDQSGAYPDIYKIDVLGTITSLSTHYLYPYSETCLGKVSNENVMICGGQSEYYWSEGGHYLEIEYSNRVVAYNVEDGTRYHFSNLPYRVAGLGCASLEDSLILAGGRFSSYNHPENDNLTLISRTEGGATQSYVNISQYSGTAKGINIGNDYALFYQNATPNWFGVSKDLSFFPLSFPNIVIGEPEVSNFAGNGGNVLAIGNNKTYQITTDLCLSIIDEDAPVKMGRGCAVDGLYLFADGSNHYYHTEDLTNVVFFYDSAGVKHSLPGLSQARGQTTVGTVGSKIFVVGGDLGTEGQDSEGYFYEHSSKVIDVYDVLDL